MNYPSYMDLAQFKQFQGSKKKARKKAFEERQKQKQHKHQAKVDMDKALEEGDIEETARLMGVKLK